MYENVLDKQKYSKNENIKLNFFVIEFHYLFCMINDFGFIIGIVSKNLIYFFTRCLIYINTKNGNVKIGNYVSLWR